MSLRSRLFRRRTNRRKTSPGVRVARGASRAVDAILSPLRRLGRLLLRALPYALVAACVAMLPGVVIHGYRYLTEGGQFGARDVQISGHVRLTAGDLLETAGVDHAPNLLSLDLEAIETRLLAHPWVRSAKVTRELPDRLRISVVEREPAALVALGALYLVDSRGNVFKRVEPGEHYDFPVLTGLTREDLGDAASPDRRLVAQRLLRGALTLMRSWRGSQVGKIVTISEIHMDPLFGYSAVLGEGAGVGHGATVRLGRGEVQDKLARLMAVLADAGRRGKRVAEIRLNDERDPTRVAVRFRPDPPPSERSDESGDGESQGAGDAEGRGEPHAPGGDGMRRTPRKERRRSQ